MALKRSDLGRLRQRDTFIWATGIEDTFITAPWPATGRRLDEYELTGHYEHWREDLDLVASLGVKYARYGVPWYRINPERGRWDWTWASRPLERLLDLGIQPIVDLVHYGVPEWIEHSFLHPDYPHYVAEYAGRLAERFAGTIHWYTPLNEPRITAWYCGRLGWWPPFRRGWRGFVEVMLQVCRGIVRTSRVLREVDPEIVLVNVDPADLYVAGSPDLAAAASLRQELVFLAFDLISGRLTPGHVLWDWLVQHGATEASLYWFVENAACPDIEGLNTYPMFSLKHLVRGSGGMRVRMPYGSGDALEQLLTLFWERTRLPLMITETASTGSVARRLRWLEDSVAAARRARAAGVPLCGYTWWPMYALVAWAYRQGRLPADSYLEQMGLWDLESAAGGLARVQTPLVEAFRALVADGEDL